MTRLDLAGSSTHEHLLAAFASESCDSMRFLWLAQQADIDGRPEEAVASRSAAAAATSHAQGLLEFLADIMDVGNVNATGAAPTGGSELAMRERYPEFASIARAEGFTEVGEWFDTLDGAAT